MCVRAVPCHRRASSFEKEYVEETEVEGAGAGGEEEGWLATHTAGQDGVAGVHCVVI